MSLLHRIDVAAGRKPADLLLTGGRVVSVFSGKIIETSVAIADGVIVGFGNYKARKHIDLKGGYLSSGLIDSHIHIESSLLTPAEFAKVVVPRGTTSVVADPHEIANVMGSTGIQWMLDASDGLPLDIYIGLPSCVPATNMETSGAKLGAGALKKFIKHPRVVAIGEVMNYPGVINGDPSLIRKIRLMPGMRVDGHAPGLSGKDLYAYIVAGIHSDHESIKAKEAEEKLLAGMHLMIREGTVEKNLKDLARIITRTNSHRCFFCSDDRSARDLVVKGHVDYILRKAVRCGIPPITALQMATNNAPYYFRLKRRKGAVAIGYQADLVVFSDLRRFKARAVFKNGQLVAKDGELIVSCKSRRRPRLKKSMQVKSINPDAIRVKAKGKRIRVIEILRRQLVTGERIMNARIVRGEVVPDPRRDMLKLVVVERHRATGNIGIGFVRGFGFTKGAIASSVAHDSHNIIAVGTKDEDILAAVRAVQKQGGGFVAVNQGKVIFSLPLPTAGLMTDHSAEEVAESYEKLQGAAKRLGSKIKDPFLQLSFLSLAVIPDLKLTDWGLIDVNQFKRVNLFV
jgi:adenine deaminase